LLYRCKLLRFPLIYIDFYIFLCCKGTRARYCLSFKLA